LRGSIQHTLLSSPPYYTGHAYQSLANAPKTPWAWLSFIIAYRASLLNSRPLAVVRDRCPLHPETRCPRSLSIFAQTGPRILVVTNRCVMCITVISYYIKNCLQLDNRTGSKSPVVSINHTWGKMKKSTRAISRVYFTDPGASASAGGASPSPPPPNPITRIPRTPRAAAVRRT
jgi:hypothetical protein